MPWGFAAAAAVGAAGSMAAGAMQSGAVSDAADQANQTQREAQAQMRGDLAPYMNAGTNALAPAQSLLGLNGQDAATAAMANFQQSPGYQFQLDQGIRAVESGAAAQGMLHSGATLKALQDRGNGLAAQEFGNYYNRLMGMVQNGQNSAAGVGASGVQTAQGIAQTNASAGGAQASIYGNVAQGIGNAAGNYANNSLYADQKQNALYNGQGTGLNYGSTYQVNNTSMPQ